VYVEFSRIPLEKSGLHTFPKPRQHILALPRFW
jgi:hypothetical protein